MQAESGGKSWCADVSGTPYAKKWRRLNLPQLRPSEALPADKRAHAKNVGILLIILRHWNFRRSSCKNQSECFKIFYWSNRKYIICRTNLYL